MRSVYREIERELEEHVGVIGPLILRNHWDRLGMGEHACSTEEWVSLVSSVSRSLEVIFGKRLDDRTRQRIMDLVRMRTK